MRNGAGLRSWKAATLFSLNLTLQQNIKYFLEIKKTSFKKKEELVNHYLECFSLVEQRNKLVSSLSKGMQQKTALIIALAQESELVVLDEPNLGLDLEALSILKDILRKEAIKKTIVLTTQDVKLIEDVSDYLSVLNRGTLVYSGTMDNFNSLSEKIVCSFHVDNVLTEDIKSKISSISINTKYKEKVIHGNFKKETIDTILNMLKDENYRVIDIKTYGGFENNLDTALNDRRNKINVSAS